ncbi:MAG: hypothetical protein ACOC4M_16195 [Promethearchaeia archaeon]
MPEKEKKEKTGASYLERALKSAKKTTSTLKGILKKESEEGQFYKRESKKKAEMDTPHLSYDSTEKTTEMQENYEYKTEETAAEEIETLDVEPSQSEQPTPAPQDQAEESAQQEAQIPSGTPPTQQPTGSTKLELYQNLTTFFEDYLKSYKKRYERWENSISNILSILRKMRKITKKNTEELEETINNLYDKVLRGIDQFKVKRREVERLADVNMDEMGGEFKRVLGLLSLQIKEYKMKRMTDELLPLLELQ